MLEKRGPSDFWLTPTFSLQLTMYFLVKNNSKKRTLLDKSHFRPYSIEISLKLRFKASSLIYNLTWLYFYSSNKTCSNTKSANDKIACKGLLLQILRNASTIMADCAHFWADENHTLNVIHVLSFKNKNYKIVFFTMMCLLTLYFQQLSSFHLQELIHICYHLMREPYDI